MFDARLVNQTIGRGSLFERSEIDRAGIARRVLSAAALARPSVRVAGLSFWRPRRQIAVAQRCAEPSRSAASSFRSRAAFTRLR